MASANTNRRNEEAGNAKGPGNPRAFPEKEAAARGISREQWTVLCDIVFPSARSANSILLACDLAKQKGLDVYKGHLAIVQQRQNVDKRWIDVDVPWPTQKSLIYTAHLTGSFAGNDPVKYGPVVTKTYKGTRWEDNQNKTAEQTVTFPEFAEATVYRVVQGQPRPFTAQVFVEESGSFTAGGLPVPTWTKKPYFFAGKWAIAAALRLAFPECDYSAEEMEGKPVASEADVVPFPTQAAQPKEEPTYDPSTGEVLSTKDETPSADDPTEPAYAFSQMDLDSLRWLDAQLHTANANKAFGPALSYMKSSLDPRFHTLGERLFAAAEVIANAQIAKALSDWLGSTIPSLPNSYANAVNHVSTQKQKGRIDQNQADALELVLYFYKDLNDRLAKAA
jgi:hypothetical protein